MINKAPKLQVNCQHLRIRVTIDRWQQRFWAAGTMQIAKSVCLAVVFGTLLCVAGVIKPSLADIAPNRPAAGINNLWYVTRSKNAVIVFVHGILSDSRDAWAYEGDNGSIVYWPELLRTDSKFDDYSIYLGGFHTAVDSRNYGMRDAANQLFASLSFSEGNEKSILDHSKIIFVTHSTGGIVVRHMLVRKKPEFRKKKIGLLLIASPSLGSEYANLITDVLDIAEHQMGKELQQDNGVLVDLDKDFFNMVSNRELPGLTGREAFEHHFVLGGVLKFLRQIVPVDSAVRYFAEPIQLPQTNHFTAVKPHDLSHPAYVLLSNFVRLKFEPLPQPACATPYPFNLKFSVTDRDDTLPENRFDYLHDGKPILSLKQEKPFRENRRRNLAREDDGNYEKSIQLPCVGQEFEAQFTRKVSDARLDRSGRSLVTNLCFKRKKLGLHLSFTHHQCIEGGNCEPGAYDPDIAEACPSGDQGFLHKLIFSPAHASSHVGGMVGNERWTVPSLETLSTISPNQRPGYTNFTMRSGPMPQFADADRFTTALMVNGVSVLEDGWPAHSTSEPFNHQEGLRYRFAIQNLGFSGAVDGKELIEVSFRFSCVNPGAIVVHGSDQIICLSRIKTPPF